MSNTQILTELDPETDDGIDPLTDNGYNAALSVVNWKLFTIGEREAGRPDLISYRVYGSVDFWREIMAYNGITDVRNMVNGIQIRVPERSEFMRAISKREYSFVDRPVKV